MATNLIDVFKKFGTEEQCMAYLEAMRWPDGVRCVACNGERVTKFVTKEGTRKRKNPKTGETEAKAVPARHLYQCANCGQQFSVTAGTIFHDTHLPLHKWFLAIALFADAKKGLSAKQLERHLDVNYRTAWYLGHRIRKAMEEGMPSMFSGKVEVDETYVGGRYDRRRKRGPHEKIPVVGMIQRADATACSKARAYPIPTPSKAILVGAVRTNISTTATVVYTDEYRAYKGVRKTHAHETVNHIKLEYVRRDNRDVHTNSVENFWSLFKRGLVGSFHHVSIKHLRRYLDEFTFRFSNRDSEDLFALVVLQLLIGEALRYSALTANEEPEV